MSNRDSFIKSAGKKSDEEPPIVVNAIISINGLIPLFMRKKGDEVFYDLPGGKADMWIKDEKTKKRRLETPQEAMVRELREELGIEAIVISSVPYKSPHPKFPGRDKHFFICEYISGTPENLDEGDHDAFELVSPAEAIRLLKGRISPEVEYVLKHINDTQRYRPEPSVSTRSAPHYKYPNN